MRGGRGIKSMNKGEREGRGEYEMNMEGVGMREGAKEGERRSH